MESLRDDAGRELFRRRANFGELWTLVNKVESLRELAGREILAQNKRERWVLDNIIKNPNLDFLKKEAEDNIEILDRNEEIVKMNRYRPERIRDAQSSGETIPLTLDEIDRVKKYLNSGISVYQSGFARVFLSPGTPHGNISLFIDREANFNGNMLEYIDKFSDEIYKNTGIRFCYLEGRHSPPSERLNRGRGLNVWQFILVPKSSG